MQRMLLYFLAMLETPEERKKFEELYEENRSRMYSVALKILHDEDLAEDAVNDAFVKLIDHFRRMEEFTCNQIRNYLVIVVRNAAINIYNNRRKIVEIPFDEAFNVDRKQENTLALQMEYSEVKEIIEQLPEIYSETLYLFYEFGFSVKEIASSFNLSASAIKLRLMRAKAMLRAMLEGN